MVPTERLETNIAFERGLDPGDSVHSRHNIVPPVRSLTR